MIIIDLTVNFLSKILKQLSYDENENVKWQLT